MAVGTMKCFHSSNNEALLPHCQLFGKHYLMVPYSEANSSCSVCERYARRETRHAAGRERAWCGATLGRRRRAGTRARHGGGDSAAGQTGLNGYLGTGARVTYTRERRETHATTRRGIERGSDARTTLGARTTRGAEPVMPTKDTRRKAYNGR